MSENDRLSCSPNSRLSVALVVCEGGNNCVFYREGLTIEQADAVSKLHGKSNHPREQHQIELGPNLVVNTNTLLVWLLKPYYDEVFEKNISTIFDPDDMKQKIEKSGLRLSRPHLFGLFGEDSDWQEWDANNKKIDRLYFCKVHCWMP